MSKSLLVVGEFGGNDYNTGIFGGWAITKVSSFVPHVTQAVAEGIEVKKKKRVLAGIDGSKAPCGGIDYAN